MSFSNNLAYQYNLRIKNAWPHGKSHNVICREKKITIVAK